MALTQKKKALLKIEKIEKDFKLYEDEVEDDNENWEDFYEEDSEEEIGMEIDEERESSEEEEDEEAFVPRCKLHAYQQNEGNLLKTRKRAPMKFTKGTDPTVKS